MMDFIIIGSGPGGCACASTLIEKGYSVLLFEKFDGGNNSLNGGEAETEVIVF